MSRYATSLSLAGPCHPFSGIRSIDRKTEHGYFMHFLLDKGYFMLAYRLIQNHSAPEIPKLESHEDIAHLTMPQLIAWIGSVNFKYKKHSLQKHSLVALAGLLLDQLHGQHDLYI